MRQTCIGGDNQGSDGEENREEDGKPFPEYCGSVEPPRRRLSESAFAHYSKCLFSASYEGTYRYITNPIRGARCQNTHASQRYLFNTIKRLGTILVTPVFRVSKFPFLRFEDLRSKSDQEKSDMNRRMGIGHDPGGGVRFTFMLICCLPPFHKAGFGVA